MKQIVLIIFFLPLISLSSDTGVLQLSNQLLVCTNIPLVNIIRAQFINYPNHSFKTQIDPQNGFIRIIASQSTLFQESHKVIAQISPSVQCVVIGEPSK